MKVLVEYSKEQNAFHRCSFVEREQNELLLSKSINASTYKVIGEFNDYDSADKFISENYDLIKNSRMYKDDKGILYAI